MDGRLQSRWKKCLSRLTVLIDDSEIEHLIRNILSSSHATRLAFLNAHGMNLLMDNEAFFDDISAADVVLRDGIGTALFMRLLGINPGMNCNGTDLIPKIIQAYSGKTLALYGTSKDIVDRAASLIHRQPSQNIVTLDGFQPAQAYVDSIKLYKPGLIILAMGMPYQEHMARQLAAVIDYPALIICGGAILDFLGGKVSRAPRLMQMLGLEWTYRLALEPRRLFKRYIFGNPQFLLRALYFRLHLTDTPIVGTLSTLHLYPRGDVQQGILPDVKVAVEPQRTSTDIRSVVGFRPSTPVIVPDALHGRTAELQRMKSAIFEQGCHILLYGHRGYGKTSLARIFGDHADAAGYLVVYVSCSRQASFQSLMLQLVAEIRLSRGISSANGSLVDDWRSFFPEYQDVAERLSSIMKVPTLLILDEYDRIESVDTRDQIVQLMKDLSDLGCKIHLLLVGVSNDAVHLLGHHPSIYRCVLCLPIRRLSDCSVEQLVKSTMKQLGVRMAHDLQSQIVHISAGSSYHAQLIGHNLVSYMRNAGKKVASAGDLHVALLQVLEDAQAIDPSLKLMLSPGQARVPDALLNLANHALESRDDQIRFDISLPGTDLINYCDSLCAMAMLKEHYDAVQGISVYRFSNIFAPQLIRIAHYLATSETGKSH